MDSEQTEVILLCIQGILSDEPTLLVQPYGLISLETLPISTSGYGFVTWKHPLCLLSMSNMLLNMMLSPVFTKLIFTSNPWDWFYYPHFSNIKLRVREVSLFKIKKTSKRKSWDLNPSSLIPCPVSFLELFSCKLSICDTFSLAFCWCTSTSTLQPFQELSWNLSHMEVFVMFSHALNIVELQTLFFF